MLAVFDVLIMVGLIVFNLCLLGSRRYNVRRLDARMQEVEAQAEHLRADMTNFSRRQLDALWMRAQQEVDKQIIQARQRNRR